MLPDVRSDFIAAVGVLLKYQARANFESPLPVVSSGNFGQAMPNVEPALGLRLLGSRTNGQAGAAEMPELAEERDSLENSKKT